jgi:hypothetical protein
MGYVSVLSDLSVAQLLTHTVWMIADAADKEVKGKVS